MSTIDHLPRTQIAGVYHRKVGDVLVTGLSDGYVDMGYGIFRNIPEDETKAILARDHRILPPRISVNAFALRMNGRTYLIDCGSADIMGRPAAACQPISPPPASTRPRWMACC
jgi:hypothetical protein